MPSSSKVKFSLDTLRAKAFESIDERIALAEEKVAGYQSPEKLEEDRVAWRARQEERLSQLFRQLGDGGVSNTELAEFSIETYPKMDRYDLNRAENELRVLKSKRSQIVAKSESLVGDDDGCISLTKTQLSEFFGL